MHSKTRIHTLNSKHSQMSMHIQYTCTHKHAKLTHIHTHGNTHASMRMRQQTGKTTTLQHSFINTPKQHAHTMMHAPTHTHQRAHTNMRITISMHQQSLTNHHAPTLINMHTPTRTNQHAPTKLHTQHACIHQHVHTQHHAGTYTHSLKMNAPTHMLQHVQINKRTLTCTQLHAQTHKNQHAPTCMHKHAHTN